MVFCTFGNCDESKEDSVDLEYQLAASSAVDRVEMVVDIFGVDSVTLLTSFGVQSGVMLALGRFHHSSLHHISQVELGHILAHVVNYTSCRSLPRDTSAVH